ncbi:hypothetical protein ACOME3_010627 [Neoechinorhynchus agilis]
MRANFFSKNCAPVDSNVLGLSKPPDPPDDRLGVDMDMKCDAEKVSLVSAPLFVEEFINNEAKENMVIDVNGLPVPYPNDTDAASTTASEAKGRHVLRFARNLDARPQYEDGNVPAQNEPSEKNNVNVISSTSSAKGTTRWSFSTGLCEKLIWTPSRRRGRARSSFRRRVLGKTAHNIEAANISKANTQSISTKLETPSRELTVIERYAVNLPAAKIIESLAIGLYVQTASENENGLVSESFNTLWKTSTIATPNVYSMISALRPVRTNDYIIIKKQRPVTIDWVYRDNASTLRLERYLTVVNDPIMMGMISACYEHSTLDQLHAAILSRARAKLPELPVTVVNVDMGNVLDFLSIPPIRTKDKQAIVEVMTMFGCARHDGWGIALNLDLEDVSVESLFTQFRLCFNKTDLNQFLDLTVPITQSNVAVVAFSTVVNLLDSNSNPIHNIGIWKTESPIRYELPYRMDRNIFGILVCSILRLYDTTSLDELNKLHYQSKQTCIQINGPNLEIKENVTNVV